jgi:hypothetical protein
MRGRRPDDHRWSAAEIVEHLAIVERRRGDMLAAQIGEARQAGLGAEPSREPVLPSLDISRVLDRTTRVTAPEFARPTGALSADEAWEAFEHANERVRVALRLGDGFALGTLSAAHPVLGPLSVYHWFAFVGAHEARHAAQIAELAATLGATLV